MAEAQAGPDPARAFVDASRQMTGAGVDARIEGEPLRRLRAFLEGEGCRRPVATPPACTEVHVARGALYRPPRAVPTGSA